MTTIRGDGDVLSLLDEMSSQQGYVKTPDVIAAATHNAEDGVRVIRSAQEVVPVRQENRFRFVPEEQVSDTRTDADGVMIWNPTVRVSLSPSLDPSASTTNALFPPTNPEVEVYRRRCYEKFKRKFPSIFQDVAAAPNAMTMTTDQNDRRSKAVARDGGRLWNDLAAHNILERWHFCTKLSEFLNLRTPGTHTKEQNSNTPTRFSHAQETTETIRSLLMNINNSTYSSVMDPIVVASSSVRTTRDNQKQGHLENEIVFQWRREWRKKYNTNSNSNSNSNSSKSGNGEKDPAVEVALLEQLDRFLTSTKFRKRVRKIEGEVRLLAGQLQSDFWMQLGKRAAFTATQQHGSGGGSGGHKRKRRNVPKIAFTESTEENSTLSMSVTYLGLTMHLNQSHYRKLQVLYDRFGSSNNSSGDSSFDDVNDAFASSLFCVLVRYDMLEGAGLQASMNGAVFEMLRQSFDCTMECFASPFNSWYERYCSAFPDTDAPFGSVGSFFDYDFGVANNGSGGCYQANPPFVSDFIERMYDRMDHFLNEKGEIETTTQKEISPPLMFIVFIPAWKETAGWKALAASPHLTLHVLLSQEDNPHYYCEGTQHRRKKSRHRIASFDTSVFFLQNSLARTKWHVTSDIIDKLKRAFSLPPNQTSSLSLTETQLTPVVIPHPAKQQKKQSATTDPAGSEAKHYVQRNKEEKHTLPSNSNNNNSSNRNDTVKAIKRKKQKRSTVDSEEQQLAILQGMGLTLQNDNVGDQVLKKKPALSPKAAGQKKKYKKSGKKR